LLLFASLLIFPGCYDRRYTRLQEKTEMLCRELVPDARTGLCKVTLEKVSGKKVVVKGELLSQENREKLLLLVSESGFEALDSLIILPDSALQGKVRGLVTVSVANLRAKPDHGAELVSQATMGTPVMILKKHLDWYFIQTPDHYLSWTNSSSLVKITDEELNAWNRSDRMIFTGQYGVIFSDDSGARRISDLVAGCIVKGKRGKDKSVQVELPDGRRGVSGAAYFTDFTTWAGNATPLPDNLIRTAQEFTGIPYLWGGTSSKAIDCSGFTKTVWFLNGIILERDASQQFKYGEVIDAGPEQENLKPGDLLFFGRKEPLRIVHVGIYSGNREVIHSSGQVWVNSMDSTCTHFSRYLFSTYVGSRRMTGLSSRFGYMKVKDHPWY